MVAKGEVAKAGHEQREQGLTVFFEGKSVAWAGLGIAVPRKASTWKPSCTGRSFFAREPFLKLGRLGCIGGIPRAKAFLVDPASRRSVVMQPNALYTLIRMIRDSD
jgi:hypothetical protein